MFVKPLKWQLSLDRFRPLSWNIACPCSLFRTTPQSLAHSFTRASFRRASSERILAHHADDELDIPHALVRVYVDPNTSTLKNSMCSQPQIQRHSWPQMVTVDVFVRRTDILDDLNISSGSHDITTSGRMMAARCSIWIRSWLMSRRSSSSIPIDSSNKTRGDTRFSKSALKTILRMEYGDGKTYKYVESNRTG